MVSDNQDVQGAGGGSDASSCPTTVTPQTVGTRVERARDLRIGVVQTTANLPQPEHKTNGEEGLYPAFPYQANYTKALPKRSDVGDQADVVEQDYSSYLGILNQGLNNQFPDFSGIPSPQGSQRKQTNPQAGIAFDLEGYDPHSVNLHFLFRNDSPNRFSSLRPAPRIDGRKLDGNPDVDHENAAEMIELYWMALLRDLHFKDYMPGGTLQKYPNSWPEDPSNTLLDRAVDDLNRNEVKNAFDSTTPYPTINGNVTHATIFRGSTCGDEKGPYISQFLLRGTTLRSGNDGRVIQRPEDGLVLHGTQLMQQRQRTVVSFKDYLLDVPSWRSVQDGSCDPSGKDDYCHAPLFIRNLRDLASWVHIDYLYQHFLNAALILLMEPPLAPEKPTAPTAFLGQRPLEARAFVLAPGMPMPPFPLDPGNPYLKPSRENMNSRNGINQSGFVTFGPVHVLTLLAEVTTRALKAGWFQKWYVHRRTRPEEFGGLVHFQKMAETAKNQHTDGPYPCVDPTILNAPVLDLIFQRNTLEPANAGKGTYLLPQVFPEGSPTHPAYPSGHATAAGACATILKAFFDESAPMTEPTNAIPTDTNRLPVAFVANDSGDGLIPAPGPQQVKLTIGGELNKLASNIAIGRNGAGVHWRSDATEGMKLGEAVAIGILFEQAFTFNEEHSLSFDTFFTNETVTIGRRRNATGNFVVFVRIAPRGPQAVAPTEQEFPVL